MSCSQADAMELMTIIVACHRRTAPRLDDPEAALATAQVWADLFNVYKLEFPDLKAAVMKRALSDPDAPEPAEIVAVAREIRRERAERETDEEREAREDAWDAELLARNKAKLAAMIDPVAQQKGLPQ